MVDIYESAKGGVGHFDVRIVFFCLGGDLRYGVPLPLPPPPFLGDSNNVR